MNNMNNFSKFKKVSNYFKKIKNYFLMHEYISATLFFIFLITIFFFPVIFSGKTLTTSVNWGGVMSSGPYEYSGTRPIMLPVRDPGAFGWADEPLTNYIGKVIKNEHRIPLWNPNMGVGYPILGGIQEGIFFPLNYINFIFSSQLSWDIFFLIRIFLAGFFTYIFARKIGLGKIASCVSAIIFMFNGYTIEFLNMAHFNTEVLIPLALLGTEYFLIKRNIKSFILYSIILALTILPGMPEATFFVFLISFLWFIFSLLFLHPEINKKEILKFMFFLMLANIVALLLTAVQLLPFLELLKNSFNTHSAGTAGLYSTTINFSFSLFSPFISNPIFSWIGGTISYVGISSFILSTITVLSLKNLSSRNKKILLFFFIFIFFMLAKCYGLFFINWIGNLPILNTLIFPKYAIPSIIFSFSIISGLELSLLINKEIKWLNIKIFCALIIILVSFFFMLHETRVLFSENAKSIDSLLNIIYSNFNTHFPIKIPELFLESNRILFNLLYLILTLFIGLILTFIFWLLLISFSHKRTLFSSILIMVFIFLEFYAYALPLQRADRYDTYKKAPYLNFLESENRKNGEIFRIFAQSEKKVQPSVLYPNISSVFGLQDIRFLLALGEKRYFTFLEKGLKIPIEEINSIRFTGDYPIPLDVNYLDLLNVKYFIIPKDSKISDSIGKIVYNNEVQIIENKNYLPRTFFVQKAVVSLQNDVFSKLDSKDFDFEKEIIIEDKLNNRPIEDNTEEFPSTNSKATITKYSDEQINIEVQTNISGYLVLLDQYYPGWKAYVDGIETEIYPTDYIFRSIYLNKGNHEVEFIYKPESYKIGKWISGFTFLILIFFFLKRKIIEFYNKNFVHRKIK